MKFLITLCLLLSFNRAFALETTDPCFEFVSEINKTMIGYFDLIGDPVTLEEEGLCRKYFLQSEDFEGYTLILSNREGSQCIVEKIELGLIKDRVCNSLVEKNNL